ncbi:MAG: hypothetical protein IPL53_19045 [Ignavibacteria bacterium]|nr:hypothetical protein [Ignavibacteria bacterium]
MSNTATIKERKRWTKSDEKRLGSLVRHNTPAIVIGLMLGRTSVAVKSKANEPGVSMRLDNQSRYRRRKK